MWKPNDYTLLYIDNRHNIVHITHVLILIKKHVFMFCLKIIYVNIKWHCVWLNYKNAY